MINKEIIWTDKLYKDLLKELKNQKDSDKFLKFNQTLIKTKYPMIGIKVPNLRKISKKISKTNIISFLEIVKEDTYEEIMLEGLVISYIEDKQVFLNYFNRFIEKIDNWAICDISISSMKIFKNNQDYFYKDIIKYLKSDREFTVRVGLVILLYYYINDKYINNIFSLIDEIDRKEYYINMAVAWLISECFVKYKDLTSNYLDNNNLSKETYNKAIQKILESNRVAEEDKLILRQNKSN